mgnify:CR=1 FL=1
MSVTFAFGCICGNIDLTQKFAGNELVFKARILKIHPNSSPQESYYKVDLEYLEGFKGTSVETIFVYGSTDGNIRSSCDIFLNENSIIIFFANKIDDRIVLDPCHGHIENDFILKSLDKKKRIKEFDASVVNNFRANVVSIGMRIDGDSRLPSAVIGAEGTGAKSDNDPIFSADS